MILSSGLHLCQMCGVKGFQIHIGDVESVQSPFHSQIHELHEVDGLFKSVGVVKSPALAKSAEVQGIGVHA